MSDEISFDDYLKVDIRTGTITEVHPFPEARKPAHILLIDFGEEIGIKKSSAQITAHYDADELVGRQVMAVVNFPPRQIGPLRSEVLTLGFEDENGGHCACSNRTRSAQWQAIDLSFDCCKAIDFRSTVGSIVLAIFGVVYEGAAHYSCIASCARMHTIAYAERKRIFRDNPQKSNKLQLGSSFGQVLTG